MRPLVIGNAEKEKLAVLRKYAEDHPYSASDMLDLMNGEIKAAGNQKEFQCEIPVGFKIVFTIEGQPPGPARHLSISVPEKGRFPSPEACEWVMEMLGFKNKFNGCRVWIEEEIAVNILELI